MRRGKVLWELERVKWKHITETRCVEQFGGDEQRRRGQGENWTHAGRICLGALGEQNEGGAHHHGGQERVWSLKACQKLSGIVCGRSNAGSLGHTVMLPGVPTSRELCWLSSTHLYNLLAVQSFHLLPALTEIRESLNIS